MKKFAVFFCAVLTLCSFAENSEAMKSFLEFTFGDVYHSDEIFESQNNFKKWRVLDCVRLETDAADQLTEVRLLSSSESGVSSWSKESREKECRKIVSLLEKQYEIKFKYRDYRRTEFEFEFWQYRRDGVEIRLDNRAEVIEILFSNSRHHNEVKSVDDDEGADRLGLVAEVSKSDPKKAQPSHDSVNAVKGDMEETLPFYFTNATPVLGGYRFTFQRLGMKGFDAKVSAKMNEEIMSSDRNSWKSGWKVTKYEQKTERRQIAGSKLVRPVDASTVDIERISDGKKMTIQVGERNVKIPPRGTSDHLEP